METLSKPKTCSLLSLSIILTTLILAMPKPCSAQTVSPQDCLPPHNSARAAVGVPPLAWDATLAAYAQNYANQRKADCRLVHSNGPYGENLAWSSGDLSCSAAVNLWVSEKPDYDYNSNSCAPGKVCGHYTQVVWRRTTQVGCARVRCDNNRGTFVICSYSPRGNYIGQRPY